VAANGKKAEGPSPEDTAKEEAKQAWYRLRAKDGPSIKDVLKLIRGPKDVDFRPNIHALAWSAIRKQIGVREPEPVVDLEAYVNDQMKAKPGSPAVDAGTASLASHAAAATDLEGLARPFGAAWDIGAYELQSTTPPAGTATVAGTTFNDLNGNGGQDAGEPGLAGWTVYIDAHRSGTPDAGETRATTDAAGRYTLAGIAPGTYRVAAVFPTRWGPRRGRRRTTT
jgi:hypothetical protein